MNVVVILLDLWMGGGEEVVEGIENLPDCQDLTEYQWFDNWYFDVDVAAEGHIQHYSHCVLDYLLVSLSFTDIDT